MNRRQFVIGMGSAVSVGTAVLGSGAFTRSESQRDVTVEIAADPDAYLGLDGTGSINSNNYVEIDDNGHLAIDVADSGNGGEGVNSDSFTWFDSMVQVCNQGKATIGFYIREPTDEDFPEGVDATGIGPYADEPRLQFYTGEAGRFGDAGTISIMGEANAQEIPVGECIELGLRTMTKGVDATETGPGGLFDEEVVLVGDVHAEEDLPAEEFGFELSNFDAPTSATQGEEIRTTVRLQNNGPTDAQKILFAIRDGDGTTLDHFDFSFQRREPGGVAIVKGIGEVAVDPGAYVIAAESEDDEVTQAFEVLPGV